MLLNPKSAGEATLLAPDSDGEAKAETRPEISNFDPKGHFDWLHHSSFIQNTDWWNIYEEAFPVKERDSKEQLLLALKQNIALIGSYKIQREMVAIAVIYRAQSPSFGFLHYFAVAPNWRNKKLGSYLFHLLVKEAEKFVIKNHTHSLGLIWEIEDPEHATDPKDQSLQHRRIHFYQKLGGKLFPGKFIQPGINGFEPVPMQLMHFSTYENLPEEKIARAIYLEKYGVVNAIAEDHLLALLARCHNK
ncbi:MAG: GNAT family N-acetyltransferase [Gammaproteobacteria bacterium]|nr:GNAT family N-acetyltransferase [Gammaproteobacteria bacterium]